MPDTSSSSEQAIDLALTHDAASATAPNGSRVPLSSSDMVAALRALPHGGLDDAARNLVVSPPIRSTVSPMITAIRSAAVLYGMIFGAAEAFTGSYSAVATLTVCLFITSWRTMIPIKLGSPARIDQIVAQTDILLMAIAIGYSGGTSSSFIFCVIAAIGVAAFGWGYISGVIAVVVASVGLAIGAAFASGPLEIGDTRSFGVVVGVTLLLAAGAAFLRNRLVEAEIRRQQLAGRVDSLAETNALLTMLNSVARTLPTSLNQRDALDNARGQIVDTFRGNVICLLEFDENNDEWVPKLAEGCMLKPTSSADELPVHLRQATDIHEPWLVSDLRSGSLQGINPESGSGLYTKLVSRGRTVGVLGIEHPTPGHYTERDRRLLYGMADVVALTLDNARWFGRLRSLGAEEERGRIARDLHDRLGQWLTYISFELERYISIEGGQYAQLTQLYNGVQTALDELRETLRQLRSGISEGRPLSVVGRELVDRYAARTGIDIDMTVTDNTQFMPVPVENELLRILQEALNNIDKHANAERVKVTWAVSDGTAVLTVSDDGIGFDEERGVRDSAYGLVGMRERTDVIGGRLSIDSTPNVGTTVTVSVGSIPGTGKGS